MNFLRFLMFLSLAVWLGGILFFGAVLAPTVFMVLPTHTLAGMVVSRSIHLLHIMGIVSGIVFLAASFLYPRLLRRNMARALAEGGLDTTPSAADVRLSPSERITRSRRLRGASQVLVVLMLALTFYSEFGLTRRMNTLRIQMGDIDSISLTDARRVEFDRLHVWATGLEETVFVFGLAVLYLTSRRLS